MRMVAGVVIALVLMVSPAFAQTPPPTSYTLLDTVKESLFGDVYAHPERWQPLSAGTFFSEGWNRPWVSPPPGSGGAPRQGWIGAFDGVFYRLGFGTFSFADDFHDNGNRYAGDFTLFLPLSARFEVRLDIPAVVSNRAGADNDYSTNFGDLQIRPRVLISESQDFSQSFSLGFRIPTGSGKNGNDFAAVSPAWEFWWNAWSKLVLRGGLAFELPYTQSDRTRQQFNANFAAGYYFTPHNLTPFGDLVFYVAANLGQPIDSGPKDTNFSLTPGFRTHLGANWYWLTGVEVPVAHPKPFDVQVITGLMKVF
jgi:hypothetical protein